jgi:hypothetical protein
MQIDLNLNSLHRKSFLHFTDTKRQAFARLLAQKSLSSIEVNIHLITTIIVRRMLNIKIKTPDKA